MEKKLEITYQVEKREELSDDILALINEAELAILSSHAPYSEFHVGAALLLDDGTMVRGSNQENASYPIGYCAERTALAAKISQAPDQTIQAIAIATFNKAGKILPPVAPCGMCRQALMEEEQRQGIPMVIYLTGNDGNVMVIHSTVNLLPFRFDHTSFDK